MHKNFVSLKQEKRDGIINAALDEFATRGYDLASTNSIVKTAGISKGALFHYFDSKKQLYFFLCDYLFEIIGREYYEKIPSCGGDLIARYREAAILKGLLYDRYPRLFEFVKTLGQEKSAEVARELSEKLNRMIASGYRALLEGIDESLFRPDIHAGKARELLIWAIEGYGNKQISETRALDFEAIDKDALNSDFDSYLDVLRRCFYKQEGGR